MASLGICATPKKVKTITGQQGKSYLGGGELPSTEDSLGP